jgi:hypothetical protein
MFSLAFLGKSVIHCSMYLFPSRCWRFFHNQDPSSYKTNEYWDICTPCLDRFWWLPCIPNYSNTHSVSTSFKQGLWNAKNIILNESHFKPVVVFFLLVSFLGYFSRILLYTKFSNSLYVFESCLLVFLYQLYYIHLVHLIHEWKHFILICVFHKMWIFAHWALYWDLVAQNFLKVMYLMG